MLEIEDKACVSNESTELLARSVDASWGRSHDREIELRKTVFVVFIKMDKGKKPRYLPTLSYIYV